MCCMIKPHSRFVTKATHTLLRPRQVFSDPAAHAVKNGWMWLCVPQPTVWSLATKFSSQRSCWLHMPFKVLVIIWMIWINSDNTPIQNYAAINVLFFIITLAFWECICYLKEFGPVVYVSRFQLIGDHYLLNWIICQLRLICHLSQVVFSVSSNCVMVWKF